VVQDASDTGEQTMVSGNIFGTVTNKRVIFNRRKGWLGGSSREDIALNHVTSVRLDVERHIFGGLVCLIISIWIFSSTSDGSSNFINVVLGIAFFAGCVLLFWNTPNVVINTAGQDKTWHMGSPWQWKQAEEFVEAVRQQIVRR